MEKINFTKEDQAKLNELAGNALFKGTTFKASFGTEENVYDLVHNCTINTLEAYLENTNKQIEKIKGKSRWTLNEYQQQKARDLEKTAELLDLLIGYKYYQEQNKTVKAKLSAAKATLAALEENAKTPEQRLKEAQDAVMALESQLG